MSSSLPARRLRDQTAVVASGGDNEQQQDENSQQQLQQQQQLSRKERDRIDFLPKTLVTTEAQSLISKVRDSAASYRRVNQMIEEIVMYGFMKGLDERTIMMKCRQVMEENTITEVGL